MFEKYETEDKKLNYTLEELAASGFNLDVSGTTPESVDRNSEYRPESINDFVTVTIFTPEECDEIIKYCTKKYKYQDATLDKGTRTDPEVRNSKVIWIRKRDKSLTWVHDRIKNAIMNVNEKKYNFDIVGAEKIQFTKYEKGHHYTWHTDMGEYDPSNKRKLSVTVNLTDGTCYDGGNLLLLVMGNQYYTIPPERGQAIIFPSYVPHIVTEVQPKPGSG